MKFKKRYTPVQCWCGRIFASKQAMHIHQTKMHKIEETSDKIFRAVLRAEIQKMFIFEEMKNDETLTTKVRFKHPLSERLKLNEVGIFEKTECDLPEEVKRNRYRTHIHSILLKVFRQL